MKKAGICLKKNWIAIIVLLQPFLDMLAFFTANENGTASGYIRLGIMAALFICTLIKKRGSGRFFAATGIIAAVFALHILNGFRTGYADFGADLSYAVKVAYMPVMAVCLCACIDSAEKRDAVLKALLINAAVETAEIAVSWLTGTFTTTYGPGLGISGWVIEDNRCCHSDIISVLGIVAAYFSIKSGKKYVNLFVPAAIAAVFLTNGTTACYLTLLAVTAGYPVFMIFRAFVRKEKLSAAQRVSAAALACIFALSILIYPVTPRCKMEEIERSFYSDTQEKFEKKMKALGYDLSAMTAEEKMNDETVHDCLVEYYRPFLFSGVPSMVRRFDIDRIMLKYGVTHDATVLGDNREMKQVYASLLFEDCDFLTRLTGFEFSTIGADLTADLENDWYAIFYYYGYIGFAFYAVAALYLLVRIALLIGNNFKESLSGMNFCLLMSLLIALGLGYFSGATMRRPNASIYLSIICALVYFQTGAEKNEA